MISREGSAHIQSKNLTQNQEYEKYFMFLVSGPIPAIILETWLQLCLPFVQVS